MPAIGLGLDNEIITRWYCNQCSLPSLTDVVRCVMTNLPRNVPTLLYRQVDALLPGLVVTVGLVIVVISARADLLTHSLTLLLVTKTSIIIL